MMMTAVGLALALPLAAASVASSLLFLGSSLFAAPTSSQCNDQLDEKDVPVTLSADGKTKWIDGSQLPAEILFPPDFEGTVDRCHPNDMGMVKMADEMYKVLKPALAFGGKRPLKVLAIGNSYAQSLLKKMPQVAKDMGVKLDLLVANIGGCSMEKHVRLMEDPKLDPHDRPWSCNYSYADGTRPNLPQEPWNFLRDAILADDWDIVTVQQASSDSWRPETYHPWGDNLVGRVRALCPKAEIVVQETWSDHPGSGRLKKWGLTTEEMYARLHAAYADFAKPYGYRIIPTGAAVEKARAFGMMQKTVQDPHLNSAGEFLQALVWTEKLFGADVTKGSYVPEGIDADLAVKLRVVAHDAVVGTSAPANVFQLRNDNPSESAKVPAAVTNEIEIASVKSLSQDGKTICEALFDVDENATAVLVEDRGKVMAKVEEGLKWIDGETLPLEGKPFADADTYFARLPSSAKSGVVQGTWMMGHCTPGMSYVFRADARKIRLRWSLTREHLSMSHMPATGVSGLDLYVLGNDGEWTFRKCCIPRKQHDNEVEVKIEPGRTYRLYLPLFNGIAGIAFGIEKDRTIEPVPLAPGKKPIVFYGGSVAQGACVTRPGNSWVNIAGRKLGWPTVCMGFNGQGRMTIFEAELIAKIDAAAYGFLCFGNMDAATGKETCLAFLRRLHELRPDVPIALGAYHYVLATGPEHAVERGVAAEVVRELKAEDPKSWAKLTVVPVEKLCPVDCDGSVDGGHPNDYGAWFMAEGFAEALRTVMDCPNGEDGRK